jgi:hypothetical protein
MCKLHSILACNENYTTQVQERTAIFSSDQNDHEVDC